LGGQSPKKFGGPKTNFGLRDQNISRYEQDIVDRKTALETAITPLRPTKFGELWSTNGENGTVYQPTQNQLFWKLISQGLRCVVP